ncbi:hypothetical protein [Vibrio sp. WXL210]|uniref:aldose epimerase family protein n=1 Tax=Vibrio sp. WXL210 TaxID=3450709 RepID=UPI003EC68075
MTDLSFGRYKGLDSIILTTPQLRAEWLPTYGSKLCSLKVLSSGEEIELLYQSPEQTLTLPPYGASFADFDMSGFDECFPTIKACTLPGSKHAIPDHGEVWALPWECEVGDERQLHFSVTSPHFGYTLRKSVKLEQHCLESHYQLSLDNNAAPLPFMWTPHALFKASPQTRIVVPSHLQSVISVCDTSPLLGDFGAQHPWPLTKTPFGEYDLAQIASAQSALCDKFYFNQRLRQGDEFGFENEQVKVMMNVDHRTVPWLSIWKNQAGFRGHYNFALEPCTAAFDSIAEAASNAQCQIIEPGECCDWHFNLNTLVEGGEGRGR